MAGTMLTQAASFPPTIPLEKERQPSVLNEGKEGGTWRQSASHLASSLATVSLGQVMKAAEWVPDVYVSDAMEKVLKLTVLSSWNINTLASSVWGAG